MASGVKSRIAERPVYGFCVIPEWGVLRLYYFYGLFFLKVQGFFDNDKGKYALPNQTWETIASLSVHFLEKSGFYICYCNCMLIVIYFLIDLPILPSSFVYFSGQPVSFPVNQHLMYCLWTLKVCSSQYFGSGLDPDSITSVNPDSKSGSGPRRAKMTHILFWGLQKGLLL